MNSSKSILHSTGIIGFSQALSMMFGLIKSKVIAMFLGPEGFGLVSTLQASINVVQGVTSLGIDNSAVRDIAKANSKGDSQDLSAIVKAQRRIVFFTGLLGFAIVAASASVISEITFGNASYLWEIRLLSFVVFFNIIRGGQDAVLQGTRRIKEIALVSVISAMLSGILAVPIFYFLKFDGIVVFLIFISISQFILAWWFSRKIQIEGVVQSWIDSFKKSKSMIRLGFAFMGGSMVALLATFIIKVLIVQKMGVDAVGLYQAAFIVSGIYANTILQAMAKDFYPRLAAVAFTSADENKIINDQIEIGSLLAAPGILLTLALSPYAINILYSDQFVAATPILQMILLGIFIRVVSWPISYLFISRSQSVKYFYIQLALHSLHVILSFLLIAKFGLIGLGIAFIVVYLFHFGLNFFLAHLESDFKLEKKVLRRLFHFSTTFAASFFLIYFYSHWIASLLISIAACWYGYVASLEIMKILGLKGFKDLGELVKRKMSKK